MKGVDLTFPKLTHINSVIAVLGVWLIQLVDAKYCWYEGSDGSAKYYYCGVYEHCCSRGCCDNFMSFYRLWYFWFSILVILMFCSGGSYWYKRRYLRQRIVVDQPCNVNNTTILSVGYTNQHLPTNINASGWDPYANAGRPGITTGTVQVAPAHSNVATFFTPPPAYSTVINQQATGNQEPPPPSYASTMVLDATHAASENTLQTNRK